MGSGTTALAAIEGNRQYIGIELMEQYAQLARKRVNQLRQTPKLMFA
jgi:DNA modification methylase